MKTKILSFILCFLMIKAMGQQHDLTIMTFGQGANASYPPYVDGSVLDGVFDNVNGDGAIQTNDWVVTTPLSSLPQTAPDPKLVQVIFVAASSVGVTPTTIQQSQADALVQYVTNGGIILGNLEGVKIAGSLIDANKYIAEALLCNKAGLNIIAASGGSAGISPVKAFHKGTGILDLNANGGNIVSTTASYSYFLGVPSENSIMVAENVLGTPNCNTKILDMIVPAYPGMIDAMNSCNVKGFAILSGEFYGALSSHNPSFLRDESQLNINYAQLIYDFLYNPVAMIGRYAWSNSNTNFNTNCPPLNTPCRVGSHPPILTTNHLFTNCPSDLADLNVLLSNITILPTGISVVWFTNNTHTGTAYATPATATIGTYYAFYYDQVNNCYSNATDIVNVVSNCSPCINTAFATPITVTTLTNETFNQFGVYKIDHDITIDGDIYFVNSEVIIAPDVKITVLPNATLHINSSHFHTCSDMWKGIDVLAGGKVDLDGRNHFITTIIEDADIAVNYSFPTGSTNYTDGYLLITRFTIFNRNRIGVKISNYKSDSRGKSVFPFYFGECAFTSRKIDLPNPQNSTTSNPATYPTMSYNEFLYNSTLGTPLYTLTADAPLKLASPYISNTLYPDDVADAYLKTSTPNQKPDAGIVVENVALQQLAASIDVGNTYCCSPVEIMPNVFDNLNIGIDANASNFNVQTCVFQKPPANNSNAIGIKLANGSVNKARIGLQPTISENTFNAFYDIPTAISANNFDDLTINYNVFRSSRSTLIPNTSNGNFGIYATSDGFKNLQVNWNEFTNLKTAVNVADNFSNGIKATGVINITENTIQDAHPQIIPITGNESANEGIVFSSLTTINNTTGNVPVNIIHNPINNAYNGIKITALRGKNCVIVNNPITLKADPNIGTGEQYGIKLEGGLGVVGSATNGNVVEDNVVNGTNNTDNIAGIKLSLQSNTNVQCNTVANSQHGFKFEGLNAGTHFFDNIIDLSNQFGFTLWNGGIIGKQGQEPDPMNAKVCPSNNNFVGDATSWLNNLHYMTYCYNSAPSLSPLVVRNTSAAVLNPEGGGRAFPINNPSNIYTTQCANCSTTIYVVPSGTTPDFYCTRCNHATHYIRVKWQDPTLLNDIANGTVLLPNDNPDWRFWVMQQQLYDLIMADPNYYYNNLTNYSGAFDLQQFIYDNQWSSLDFINYASKCVADNNYARLEDILGFWPQSSNANINAYYDYFDILAQMYNSPGWTPDPTPLLDYANACPTKYGTIVYAWRNLYNAVTYSSGYNFVDNCGVYNQLYGSKSTNANKPAFVRLNEPKVKNTNKQETKNAIVYPNPANTIAVVKYANLSSIIVTDLTGRVLQQQKVNNDNITTINVANLQNGLYLVKITTVDGKQKVEKLIVQK